MDSKSPADKETITSSHKLYKEATRKRQGQTSYSREAPLIGGSVMLAFTDAGSCRRAARDDGR